MGRITIPNIGLVDNLFDLRVLSDVKILEYLKEQGLPMHENLPDMRNYDMAWEHDQFMDQLIIRWKEK